MLSSSSSTSITLLAAEAAATFDAAATTAAAAFLEEALFDFVEAAFLFLGTVFVFAVEAALCVVGEADRAFFRCEYFDK